MKSKKTILTLSTAALIFGLLIALPVSVNAYRGDPSIEGPEHTEEREQEMDQAFENNDYNAWVSLMTDKGRVTQVINESNFARFAQAHKLAEEGNLDESNQIRAELGLGLGSGLGDGSGQGNGQGYQRSL